MEYFHRSTLVSLWPLIVARKTMFVFGIYLPPYLARVISYLYNFLSGPVFISIPPGGTVSNGRAHPSPLLISQQQDQCSVLCIISLSIFFITHMSGIISYLKSHSPSIYLYIHIYIFFLGFQILIYIWKTIVSVSCCANNWTLNLNMLIM